jgi:hypothetical protein
MFLPQLKKVPLDRYKEEQRRVKKKLELRAKTLFSQYPLIGRNGIGEKSRELKQKESRISRL